MSGVGNGKKAPKRKTKTATKKKKTKKS